jgi:hypothetical protein
LTCSPSSLIDSTSWVPTNGTTWGQYVSSYAGINLYNFAISGATCDNRTTPRAWYFPDITKDELGSYYNLTATVKLDPEETLYTIWIGALQIPRPTDLDLTTYVPPSFSGTNDVGSDEILSGYAKGTILDISTCAVNVIKTLYQHGARNFLFQNVFC